MFVICVIGTGYSIGPFESMDVANQKLSDCGFRRPVSITNRWTTNGLTKGNQLVVFVHEMAKPEEIPWLTPIRPAIPQPSWIGNRCFVNPMFIFEPEGGYAAGPFTDRDEANKRLSEAGFDFDPLRGEWKFFDHETWLELRVFVCDMLTPEKAPCFNPWDACG